MKIGPASFNPSIGFGTGNLGSACFDSVTVALSCGFRKFDTAETDVWYDQQAVGRALRNFFENEVRAKGSLFSPEILISTKIPPWELTSRANIRKRAAVSRRDLVGFCDTAGYLYPLDTYFIHAPNCALWKGWHPRCDNAPEIISLREAWLGMEAVVELDHSARRIGLSNVDEKDLLDIISFVDERRDSNLATNPPPRMPDIVQAYADPLLSSKELRRICSDHGIEFESYSTLGHRHLLKFNATENPVLNNSVIKELSARYGKSTVIVVLMWALQNKMSIIPRSSNCNHIKELAKLLTEAPCLTEGDVALINAISLN